MKTIDYILGDHFWYRKWRGGHWELWTVERYSKPYWYRRRECFKTSKPPWYNCQTNLKCEDWG